MVARNVCVVEQTAVVAPGFLTNPDVVRWLSGVEPAWTALDFDSYNALHDEPSAGNRTIWLEPGLTVADLSGSAVVRAAQTLLRHAVDVGGLKLTATGNLSRSVVAEMFGVIEWPDYDRQEMLRINKVMNEPDLLPLHFLRVLMQESKFFRRHRGMLVPTRLGKGMLSPERDGALQAILFHIAFWHLNLGYFDRIPFASWPQSDVGVVLWSLSAAANVWLDRETLTRLCAVPVIGVLESPWDLGSFAMEARILRPLTWFGLLEYRSERGTGPVERQLYRKTTLFDRFVKFEVMIERSGTRH
jgi:hypothetical protein